MAAWCSVIRSLILSRTALKLFSWGRQGVSARSSQQAYAKAFEGAKGFFSTCSDVKRLAHVRAVSQGSISSGTLSAMMDCCLAHPAVSGRAV